MLEALKTPLNGLSSGYEEAMVGPGPLRVGPRARAKGHEGLGGRAGL